MYWIFAIGGYLGAFLTAFYAFRIVFRVFYGEPVPEAKELEGGHLAHGEPVNPATGEPEDTDVGFPGPEHHIAEREWPMRTAMGVLGVGALFAGLLQVPGRDRRARALLRGRPSTNSALDRASRSRRGDAYLGMIVGGDLSLLGIGARLLPLHRRPGIDAAACATGSAAVHDFLFNKWYFDELLDALVYRPVDRHRPLRQRRLRALRRPRASSVGAPSGVARGLGGRRPRPRSPASSASTRCSWSPGFAGLGLYFLVVSG